MHKHPLIGLAAGMLQLGTPNSKYFMPPVFNCRYNELLSELKSATMAKMTVEKLDDHVEKFADIS